ncbi:MAG: DNA double-strand break repair nuclease NurA [Candidatus Nanohaloarchaea archaeon]
MATLEEAAEELSRMGDSASLERKFSGIDTIEKGSTVLEEDISKSIEPREPGKVAGVDGGLVKKRYAAGDVVATRAVSAIFSFPGPRAEYIPGSDPVPEFHVSSSGDSRGLERKAETERLRAEVETALEALERADRVFMDGSVVPGYLDDGEVLGRYEELFEKASKGSLAGVVEDSHGLKLSDIMEQKTGVELGDIRDTVLMDALLQEGERSFVRRYSDSPVEHPVLKNISDRHANRINTFYVRLSSRDVPLRVDYYGDVEDADIIAGEMLSLKSSESYTVPSPVVEADRRAKIPEKHLKRLEKRFSPDLRRRDRRTF